MLKKKSEFYSLDEIKKRHADYNLIFGERSNGKTTAVLNEILLQYIHDKKEAAYIRRFDEDLKSDKATNLFDNIISFGWIDKYTNHEYNSVIYFSKKYFLCKYNSSGEKIKQDPNPFMYAFSIPSQEHFKSVSYPRIKIILFDEFISNIYIPNEFINFQNLLSTIIRLKDDVVIYMCGNTINKYNVYFREMGISNHKKMKPGDIDLYTYPGTDLKVAVEYSDFKGKDKPSNKYFAFNNPKLKMITTGGWEIGIHPHLMVDYKPKDVVFKYYICFDKEKFECEVIQLDNNIFTFIHRKTTPIKETIYPVYVEDASYLNNYSSNILKPRNKIEKFILSQFRDNKVFYQDNDVGETIRNYLVTCDK